MLKKFLNLFSKKEKKKVDGFEYASQVIDHVLTPSFKKQMETVNGFLKENNVRIGVELKWIVEKIN